MKVQPGIEAVIEEVLETDRLLLEPLRRDHAAHLFAPLSDSRIYTFIPQDPPVSSDALETRYGVLEGRRSPARDEWWLNWAVRLKRGAGTAEDPEHCGYIGTLQATVPHGGPALIAYLFSPAFHGNGYAAESCRSLLCLLFTHFGREEVFAETDTRNVPSQRLLERLGFTRRETRFGADSFKGEPSDEYVYGLKREDWEV